MSNTRILVGDVRERLAEIPDASVQCCVTSPPYWGLRDYGCDGQIGLEQTPEEYVAEMVAVFREVRRCLRDDGTLWLNIGDSYGKRKQLTGIPWMVAFRMQGDGWTLRAEVIWHKPSVMPDAATDRPTRDHEQVFLFSRSMSYLWNAGEMREEGVLPPHTRNRAANFKGVGSLGRFGRHTSGSETIVSDGTRNVRTVWTIASQPFPGSHFAVMPPELAEKCIRAGSAEGDTVLDPFGGAGTTALVANRLGRDAILCELNPEYAEMAQKRVHGDAPMFNQVEVTR